MKKILFILMLMFVFGFTYYSNKIVPAADLTEDFNIGLNGLRVNTFVIKSGESHIEALRDVVLYSKGNITLFVADGEQNRLKVYLPTSPNGEKKIQCSLWFCPITKTLKASPVNAGTCGGFE